MPTVYLLMLVSGRKSLGEQLNITASLSIWSKLYLDGEFGLSTCPIKPFDTSSLKASSDWLRLACSRKAFALLITNNSISDFTTSLATR